MNRSPFLPFMPQWKLSMQPVLQPAFFTYCSTWTHKELLLHSSCMGGTPHMVGSISCGFFGSSPYWWTLGTINRVALNNPVSFHVYEHIFADNLLEMKFLDISMGFFFFNMDRYCQITFHGDLHSHQQPLRTPVSSYPRQQFCYQPFWSLSIW